MKKEVKNKFDTIFFNNYARLKAYACRYVGITAAEDIVQDVFLYLLNNIEIISSNDNLSPLLYRMVHNRCLNVLRHKNIINEYSERIEKEFLELEIKFYAGYETDIERQIHEKELIQQINKEIKHLPERCRQVFILSYRKHMKSADIALLLNITKGTVENHLYNALTILRQRVRVE